MRAVVDPVWIDGASRPRRILLGPAQIKRPCTKGSRAHKLFHVFAFARACPFVRRIIAGRFIVA
jgi:hypothetical protein